ncbi:2'-5' RNA ligase family protein [Agromyces sp. MMS24-JH15]|uniref:2'-5' RNA ligase family protein n=1 Tax=Agromyces sp. MMS24-JH15 TaxID=3243765 RepID=UPI00374887CF
MARYVVVLPLSELATGEVFAVDAWPLHVTLVEPFDAPAPPEVVDAALAAALRGTLPVHATVGEADRFGRHRDVPVRLIRDGGALGALRSAVLASLAGTDARLERIRRDYRPHVTVRHADLRAGALVILDHVALVDTRPADGAHHRHVLAVHALEG